MLTVVYDACVLYPAPLRDLLMHLAITGLFNARWSDQIHDEWIRNLLLHRPDLSRKQLERTRDLMNVHVLDCLVTGYEPLIESLILPDPDDRHVLAAAIHCGASRIITFNLADFPDPETVFNHGVRAMHPDYFIEDLLGESEEAVCAAVRRQRENLKNPPLTAESLLEVLEKQRLPPSVERLRKHMDLL